MLLFFRYYDNFLLKNGTTSKTVKETEQSKKTKKTGLSHSKDSSGESTSRSLRSISKNDILRVNFAKDFFGGHSEREMKLIFCFVVETKAEKHSAPSL